MKGHSILPFFWPHLSSLANTFISKEFLRLFHFHHHVVKLAAVYHCASQENNYFSHIDKLDKYTKDISASHKIA